MKVDLERVLKVLMGNENEVCCVGSFLDIRGRTLWTSLRRERKRKILSPADGRRASELWRLGLLVKSKQLYKEFLYVNRHSAGE